MDLDAREKAARQASKDAYEQRNYEKRKEANRLSKAKQRAKRKSESKEVQAIAATKEQQYQAKYRQKNREDLRKKEDRRRSWQFCMEQGYMTYIQGGLQRRNGHLKYPEDYQVLLDVTSTGRPYRSRKADVSTAWVRACANMRNSENEDTIEGV